MPVTFFNSTQMFNNILCYYCFRSNLNMEEMHECSICHKRFSLKSNLTRQMRIHTDPKGLKCEVCEKTFTLKQHLDRHRKQHLYPVIPLYKADEARLQCTSAARDVAKLPSKPLDAVWLEAKTAEATAKTDRVTTCGEQSLSSPSGGMRAKTWK